MIFARSMTYARRVSGVDVRDFSYDRSFYAGHVSGSRMSAAVVLDHVTTLVQPTSVLDVGCGVGAWLAEWRDRGVSDVVGLDGDYVDASQLLIPQEAFRPIDLAQSFDLGRRFDLVESLEVAEHLDATVADAFVESLGRHGDLVLFSAAVPGQGGTHHINEQWLSYWVPKFVAQDFQLFDVLRPQLWEDDRVEWWYRQNTVIFARADWASQLNALTLPQMAVLDVAHPLLVSKPPPPIGVRLAHRLAQWLPRPVRRLAKTILRR